MKRFTTVIAASAICLSLISVPVTLLYSGRVNDQRRQDLCHAVQRTYDGHVQYTRFLGKESGASPERVELAIKNLKRFLEERPTCT